MRGIIFGVALCFIGCATLETAGPDDVQPSVAQDRLSAVDLKPNDCGVFVWTADASKRFILFAQDDYKLGRWFDGTSEQLLEVRDRSNGPSDEASDPDVVFTTSDGGQIELKLRDAQSISNGTRYKSGVLKQLSSEGWDRVIPVVGLATCRPVDG